MIFKSMKELKEWLDLCDSAYLSEGGQGRCYKIGNKVYKIFLQYIEDDDEEITPYFKEDILRFSDVKNDTYIFPNDVIMVGNTVVGYITGYVDALSLYKIDPLRVSLDFFENSLDSSIRDIRIISNNGILTYDVMYNILYGKDGFRIIDTLEYSKTDIDPNKLFLDNYGRFCYGIKLFLIYGYFDKIVKNYKNISDMYNDDSVSITLFLREFRKILSELEGREIKKLSEAKKSIIVRERKNHKYIREL